MLESIRPAHYLAFGYLSYIIIGTLLLMLPFSHQQTIPFLDHLFSATSAVSTTGLVTVDPGTTYTYFGQFVLLLLFQLGGLGYMTSTSFVMLAANKKISPARFSVLKTAFSLPRRIGIAHFVKHMIYYTLICEALGTALLYPYLRAAGVENPLWSALFHSVSAFCTAGFSLFATGFEGFRTHTEVNLILAALSLLGGVGFIVVTDLIEKIKDFKRELTFTTKVIVTMTLLFLGSGTLLIYVCEPSIQSFPPAEKLLISFFQAASASTTAGFNTIPIGQLALPTIMILYFLMFFGASPAGTGGGLKVTTLTALIAELWSHLRGYDKVCFNGKELPNYRIRAASMTLFAYMFMLGLALFFMSLAMPEALLEKMIFEVISALSTVGLSMGFTAEMNSAAKWVIILTMYIGRIGVVTLGMLFVSPQDLEQKKSVDLAV